MDLIGPSFTIMDNIVRVTCTAAGFPAPNITWDPVPTSGSVTVTSTDFDVTVQETSTYIPCDAEVTYRCSTNESSRSGKVNCGKSFPLITHTYPVV